MKRILFCNIAYMQCYDFDLIKEVPKHGGQYVTDTGDAYEKHNFHICEDGKVRGFVETKYRDGSASQQQPRQLRIENIDSGYKNADNIKDVTVVFCAHSDTYKKTVIVGWYQNATVHRYRPMHKGKQFNIECSVADAFLLNEEQRSFVVPRASQDGFGFGQSNVWYAKEDRSQAFLATVFDYIESHTDASLVTEECIPQEVPEEYAESGIGKQVLINQYERNSLARRRCIELLGSSCVICGFNAGEVYGPEFEGKIEVHHIVPLHEIKADYKVDPSKDLIPVCPNCHSMLHTKMANGEYPTAVFLRNLVKKTHC